MQITAGQIAKVTGGRLLRGAPTQPVTSFSTDTRTLARGEAFIALDGPSFRGESFIGPALLRGACGIIAHREPEGIGIPDDAFFIRVDDTLQALGSIARWWRHTVDPSVVAVSGSAGKTTTKEMLAHICRSSVPIVATEANLNNLIGLPKTLFRLEPGHAVAIVELGMNRPGELTELTRIADPDVGIMTNIGNAHIGNFGSLPKLIEGEAEMFAAMNPHGTAIVNLDCPHSQLVTESFRFPNTVITFGLSEKADVRASRMEVVPPFGYRFLLHVQDEAAWVTLPVFGRYQVLNALAAAAAAAALGIAPDEIADRLNSFRVPKLRSEIESCDGVTIVKDCYNASPAAMIESIRSLADFTSANRRVALIGDMLELGDHTEALHREVGRTLAQAQFDLVCCVGKFTVFVVGEVEKAGMPAMWFSSSEEAAIHLSRELRADDVLLVKGSRANKLELAIERFRSLRSEIRNGNVIPSPRAEADRA